MNQKNFVRSEITRNFLHDLPTSCGVYFLINQEHHIIYIGKAVNIQNRVRNHLQGDSSSPLKRDMAEKICTIQFILTRDEAEALLLEEELIKTYQPQYNIRMKDDKSYPYIHFDARGDFPSVKIARRKTAQSGYFYGPYTNSKKARDGLKILRQIFLLRGCSISESRFPLTRPCLDYELKLCCAPCVGKCHSSDYQDKLKKAQSFLEGDYLEVTSWLEEEMWKAAQLQDYEKAAQFRDHLNCLLNIIGRYRLVLPDNSDIDFIELESESNLANLVVVKVRKGRLIGIENFHVQSEENADRDYILNEFIENFYLDHFNPPTQICVQFNFNHNLPKRIKEKGYSSSIDFPRNNSELDLLHFARENAQKNLQLEKIKAIHQNLDHQQLMNELKTLLSLSSFPRLIEGVDISTFQGDESVGAIVAFFDGFPLKKRYRKYIIRESDHPDDFAMIEETLTRHFKKLIQNQAELPNLLVIDGGIGQLNSALKVLQKFSLPISVLALAKENEEIYLPGKNVALRLPPENPSLQFLQRIRNEVHRFVITFHRVRRNKKMFHSLLDDIPGIGPQRKNILLSAFNSLTDILDYSPQEISRQLKIPPQSIIEIQKKLAQEKLSLKKKGMPS
ncbi:MAG: excinuclease ABC subunit UvrC [Candidatus Atribacteria bacterium]|nr:excinuclease ABC subunit UvrC [Candidatus Atribacteria bacterium]